MPVCAGIGPTKTLAKLANHVAKKHSKSKGVFNDKALTREQKTNTLCSPGQLLLGCWPISSHALGKQTCHELIESNNGIDVGQVVYRW
jgi:hypothetical protein